MHDNRWTAGPVHLVLPLLPPEEVGHQGAGFSWLDFKVGCGEEVFLQILEALDWAVRYGALAELTVNVTPLVIQTDAGPIGLLMWQLLHEGTSLVHYEHFFDPVGDNTQQRILAMAGQTRFKVILRNNQTGDITGFWELDNTFSSSLLELVEDCSRAFHGTMRGSMDDRIALVMSTYTPQDLINLATQH